MDSSPVPKSGNGTSIILLFFIIILFFLSIFIGYYYITSCDPYPKKSLTDFMFDLQFNPCNYEQTPKEIVQAEDSALAERTFKDEREVFHIADQIYTYDEARCKCKAYGAELATHSQIVDAYNEGANWCTYGWSEGQNAYYPTQKYSFDELQKDDCTKRTQCGQVGINGGKFPKDVRFGANCYGIKPEGHVPVPKVLTPQEKCSLMDNYEATNALRGDTVTPFNKQQWSVYPN